MNNLSYGYLSSNNSSFSSQYASTPSNSTRFQRPRFAYAGPSSYPRPRSSASKPNSDSYSDNYTNSGYDGNSMVSKDSYRNDTDGSVTDYSRSYMDSMQNNYGDSTILPSNSLTMSRPQNSYNDSQMSSNSSAYYTCTDSFYSSPQRLPPLPNQQNNTLHSSLSDKGGFSSYSDLEFSQGTNAYFNLSSGGLTGVNQGQGLSGVGTLGRGRGTSALIANNRESNFRGKAGNFGKKRGNTRGGFQKKKQKGGNQSYFAPMASKFQLRCEICSIDFTSTIPYEMHINGARHMKKLKSKTAVQSMQHQISQIKEIDKPDGKKYYCGICGVVANSSLQLQMHLDGTKHKNKLEQLQNPQDESKGNSENKTTNDKIENKVSAVKTQINGKSNGGVVRAASDEFGEPQPSKLTKFSCDICNIIVNSNTQLEQHLSSKKHQAKVEGKPIIKKRKGPKGEGGNQEPMNQDETSSEATKKEVISVAGVKTLSASFVQGETLQ